MVAVVVEHISFTTGLGLRRGWNWMNYFEVGPAIFFVLSAFLLYEPFVIASFTERAVPSWRAFLKGRAFRVVPAYWVTLVLLIAFFRANPNNPFSGGLKVDGWKDGVAMFLFAQTYFPKWFFHGITASYTLNVEVAFYLLLPVYALVLRRVCAGLDLRQKLRRELVALAVVAVASIVYRLVIELRFDAQRRTCTDVVHAKWSCAATNWIPGYLDYFALGMAVSVVAAWYVVRDREPRWASAVDRVADVLPLVAVALYAFYSEVLGSHGLVYTSPARSEARHFVNALMVVCLLLPGVFGSQARGAYRRFLQWGPVAFLGLVSYGFYLWHQGWTDKAMSWTGSQPLHANFVLIAGIAIAMSILTAAVSWYGLERPVGRRRDLPLSRWWRPLPPPSGTRGSATRR